MSQELTTGLLRSAWAGEEYDPAHFDLPAANAAAGSV
jgi:hypothetical protein